jgi:hypothetical protein
MNDRVGIYKLNGMTADAAPQRVVPIKQPVATAVGKRPVAAVAMGKRPVAAARRSASAGRTQGALAVADKTDEEWQEF